jgi:hypothetical protein
MALSTGVSWDRGRVAVIEMSFLGSGWQAVKGEDV